MSDSPHNTIVNQSISTEDLEAPATGVRGNFISLTRRLLDWEWFTNPVVCHLFLYLLLKANWRASTFKGIKLNRGDLVFGRQKASKETGLSEQQIRTALLHLKSTSNLSLYSTNKFSIISICNFDEYQGIIKSKQPANQPATSHASNHVLRRSKKKDIFIQAEKLLKKEEAASNGGPPKQRIENYWVELTSDELTQFVKEIPSKDVRKSLILRLDNAKRQHPHWGRKVDDFRQMMVWHAQNLAGVNKRNDRT